MNSAAQLSAAQSLAQPGASAVPSLESSGVTNDDDIPELEAVEEEGPVDETGVDPKDIELVIQQVGCSRAKAVKVLKESGGDLINASASIYYLFHLLHLMPVLHSHGCERVICLTAFSCSSISAVSIKVKSNFAGMPAHSGLSNVCFRVSGVGINVISSIANASILRNNWTFPIRPARSRFLAPDCLQGDQRASAGPWQLRAPTRPALHAQTYGSIC